MFETFAARGFFRRFTIGFIQKSNPVVFTFRAQPCVTLGALFRHVSSAYFVRTEREINYSKTPCRVSFRWTFHRVLLNAKTSRTANRCFYARRAAIREKTQKRIEREWKQKKPSPVYRAHPEVDKLGRTILSRNGFLRLIIYVRPRLFSLFRRRAYYYYYCFYYCRTEWNETRIWRGAKSDSGVRRFYSKRPGT